jgi:putative membrane protein insertion efficiency factor
VNPLQHILILAVRIYRWKISPAQTLLFGGTSGCRFNPTCSQYALEAVREHGAARGSLLAAKRICRCHPWGGCGHDPIPARLNSEKLSGKTILHPVHS